MEKELKTNSIVYLSIGSNLGNRLSNIQKAVDLIRLRIGNVEKISSVYENPPVGFVSESQFYNICLSINTSLTPIEVLNETQEIEFEVGRVEKTKDSGYTSRIIDVDILFYDDLIFEEPRLKIPHPLFSSRKFVLVPLNEIASKAIDPISLDSMNVFLSNCLDESQLSIVEGSIC